MDVDVGVHRWTGVVTRIVTVTNTIFTNYHHNLVLSFFHTCFHSFLLYLPRAMLRQSHPSNV